jgi:hypothetical protein
MSRKADLKSVWDIYVNSWKSPNLKERIELFKQSLDPECCYTDPLISTRGWDELVAYMERFQSQIPGAHFEMIEFLEHHQVSVAKWNMKNGAGQNIGDGYSYGEYTEQGKLKKMTGFYKLAE